MLGHSTFKIYRILLYGNIIATKSAFKRFGASLTRCCFTQHTLCLEARKSAEIQTATRFKSKWGNVCDVYSTAGEVGMVWSCSAFIHAQHSYPPECFNITGTGCSLCVFGEATWQLEKEKQVKVQTRWSPMEVVKVVQHCTLKAESSTTDYSVKAK